MVLRPAVIGALLVTTILKDLSYATFVCRRGRYGRRRHDERRPLVCVKSILPRLHVGLGKSKKPYDFLRLKPNPPRSLLPPPSTGHFTLS